MKKCVYFILILGAGLGLFIFMIPDTYAQTEYAPGDVTRDGIVNIVDALTVAQQDTGLGTPYTMYPSETDVNEDINMDILDALLIAQYVAGIIPELPATIPPMPDVTPIPGAGEISFSPDTYRDTIIFSPKNPHFPRIYDSFSSGILVNTGNQNLAAYSLVFSYNSGILYPDTAGSSGIVTGDDGYYSAVNGSSAGSIAVSGFNETGIGPGSALNLLDLNFIPMAAGSTDITIIIHNFADENTHRVGIPSAGSMHVQIDSCTMGDVNDDGEVDIIDALPVAQYYVGLIPHLKIECADVDNDRYITIVDALLIARYYVGLIDDFSYDRDY